MRVKIDDVIDSLALMYDIVGEEKFLEIVKMYGGSNVYIPTYKSVIRNCRNREIISRFNGVNTAQLSREYGISVTHIKNIIKGI